MINSSTPRNIIVVGGNAAGPAAAAKAKRIDPSANVIMFEAGNFISTGTCELPYVLSDTINDYEKIVFFSPEIFESEKGVKVYTNHRVEKINRIARTITVKNLKSNDVIDFPYDKLILAAGSIAKRLDSLPSTLKNVFTLKSVSDLLAIQKYLSFNSVKKVFIIGAGYIGLEISEALNTLGCEITLIDNEALPLPAAEFEIQKMVLELLKEKRMEFYGSVIRPKFRYADDKVKSIEIDGWQREIDLVIQATGFEPNTSLAVTSKIEIGKFSGIKVDQKLRTSDQHIFAAGDCIEVVNQITGRPDYIPLATIARDYGHIAGENAAGGNLHASSVVKNVAVKIFDKSFVKIGLSSLECLDYKFNFDSVSSSASNLVAVMPDAQQTFGKIIYEKGSRRILGANFLGRNEVIGYADLISAFIRNKYKANDLAAINFNYTPPKSPFVNLLSILGRKIEKEK